MDEASRASKDDIDIDVLVAGAGPTGLALASQLARFGIRFRIIERQLDRAHESRALAVQARTLEILQTLGLGETLVGRGSSATRLKLHVDEGAPPTIDLGHVRRSDTRFPFVLFVAQPETEGVLREHLAGRGVTVERGVELSAVRQDSDGVTCTLRHGDGHEESVRARYVAGCDGAHSFVRKAAAIEFQGGAYPQNFVLGDVEADALERGFIHAFAARRGIALFLPLGHPATWRVMAMEASPSAPPIPATDDVATQPLSLPELQSMIDEPTFNSVTLREAAWLTRFRLHHRQAARYRAARLFLAGDAAHIHSPVGGQGMNTGIQDAWNLGWKLALVCRGRGDDRLLDSYHAERWPVGRTLLRVTDRFFAAFAQSVAGSRAMTLVRRVLVRAVVAPALSRARIRGAAFHFVSQLGIRYRSSPLSREAEPSLSRVPRAGDRLPDLAVERGGERTWLQQELRGAQLHLLLCGPSSAWQAKAVETLARDFDDILAVTYLTRLPDRDALVDRDGTVLDQLGISTTGQYLVRPDAHVAFRCGGTDLGAVTAYLEEWFSPRSSRGV